MFLPSNNVFDIVKHMQLELAGLYDKEVIRSFWFMLLEEYCGLKKTAILANHESCISESEMLKVHFAIKELKKYKPIQHILGKAWFYDLEFKVSPDVLIPRPETEELVEWIIKENSSKEKLTILDIGTGSGCIAIALAKNLTNASVFAVDISDAALQIACENAEKTGCNVSFHKMDVLNDRDWPENRTFDIIVSNPPYVRLSEKAGMKPNVTLFDPDLALYVSDEDPFLFYREILRFAKLVMDNDGTVYFEINESLGNETLKLAREMGFINIELRKDINGKDRMLKCTKFY
jgi:release factor glutamine methyltransferase